jgi:hypothetical protein
MAADVEKILVGWLAGVLSVRCMTEAPGNLGAVLPAIRVTRSGGDDLLPTFERPFVDLDCFGATRSAASLLARRAHDAMLLLLPGLFVDGAVVARVASMAGPSWAAWDNTDLRRFTASYQLLIKSPALLLP